jgi:ABC-2 type transport system permease protein
MFEADALCDRIAIINHGRIIAIDTPGGLKSHVRDLNVVEMETFGLSQANLERLRALPFVDSLSIEEHEQKQMLLIQTERGAEAVPEIMGAVEGSASGAGHCPRADSGGCLRPSGGRRLVNVRVLIKYWRAILVVAEMTVRQQLMDMFILFAVLFQPIIIALLALWMLMDKGEEYAVFVVVGSGLTGLWSSLLFVSGNSINSERWSGTLETLVALPTPFEVIVFGKNLANVIQSLISMVTGYLIASLLFGYSITIQQPLLFALSLVFTVVAFICFGLVIAPIFVMNPGVRHWQNAMEFPVYILCGFLFPIALLSPGRVPSRTCSHLTGRRAPCTGPRPAARH